MIGYIKGNVMNLSNTHLTLLTSSGVGYRVNFLYENSGLLEEEEVGLFIYTNVRENEISLYGFLDTLDLEVFEMLISISGVGPKAGQAIIAKHRARGVIDAILKSNPEGLRVSGVGLKTAEKIVLELKDKLMKKGYSSSEGESEISKPNLEDTKYREIENAFIALGYSKYEIKNLISDIIRDNPGIDKVEDFIREGLRRM